MAYRLGVFSGVGLDEALLSLVIDEHTGRARSRLDKLWTYFRNPLRPVGHGGAAGCTSPGDRAGWYTLGQEVGLPSRVTGVRPRDASADDRVRTRREVVVENDIAWRIHAMIDFMFGKPPTILSTARDEAQRQQIQRVLDAVWEACGGIALLQDLGLLGHVFGHVDLLVRVQERELRRLSTGEFSPQRAVEHIRVELIDPRRGIPVLDPDDYRSILAYVVHFERDLNAAKSPGWWERAVNKARPGRQTQAVTHIISADATQTYENGRLTAESELSWTGGRVPVVHIQNLSQPLSYEGLGEVEPLIPLQDELNTRLSDRANRVTMQCFKMYLAKGLDGFEKMAIGPGQIYSTDNPEAQIQAFGGDAASPSEDAHIAQVRDAMDKISAVPPLAGGVVQGRIGNLSSATALRVTLMGLLAKTARKRVSYGRGIAEACRMMLDALDWAGVLKTSPDDRGVRIQWPDPLPEDEHDRVLAAEGKARLGVPGERVLAELGYSSTDPGVV